MRVAELPRPQRPREKLWEHGPRQLGDDELLAILLRTGTRGAPVLELAGQLLKDFGGIAGLAQLHLPELRRVKGLGLAKVATLAAALELGRRLARASMRDRRLMDNPELVGEHLTTLYASDGLERFGCLTLDSRHRLIRLHELHEGLRTSASVEPAAVFNAAIRDGAHSVILWHTHPSGDPSPSQDDIELTRRLWQAGELLRIAVLDHLVVAREGWVSLRQRGLVPR
ncbi:MAG: DNA repair protein RadC [Acidobacteriota bacterium]|jgi:DNA repair protein RadC